LAEVGQGKYKVKSLGVTMNLKVATSKDIKYIQITGCMGYLTFMSLIGLSQTVIFFWQIRSFISSAVLTSVGLFIEKIIL